MKKLVMLFMLLLIVIPASQAKSKLHISGGCKTVHKYEQTTHAQRKHWWYFWKGPR